jgi:hypothetical protein
VNGGLSVAQPSTQPSADQRPLGRFRRKRLLIACGIATVAFDIVLTIIDQEIVPLIPGYDWKKVPSAADDKFRYAHADD